MDRVQEVWKRTTNHETAVLCLCVQRVAPIGHCCCVRVRRVCTGFSSPESFRAGAGADLAYFYSKGKLNPGQFRAAEWKGTCFQEDGEENRDVANSGLISCVCAAATAAHRDGFEARPKI